MNNLTIKQADNGYILEYEIDSGTEGRHDWVEKHVVVEVGDEDDDFTKLLYAVAEHFGYTYNKFSPNNLEINFNKKGHKVE